MDLGTIGSFAAGVGGLILGINAAFRLRRTDAEAREAKAKAITAEERTVAIAELEAAVKGLGDGLERALARATACEIREESYLGRLGAQEKRIASQAQCIEELEGRIRVLEAQA